MHKRRTMLFSAFSITFAVRIGPILIIAGIVSLLGSIELLPLYIELHWRKNNWVDVTNLICVR